MDLLLTSKNESFNATIQLPASKSISNRFLIMQALSEKKFDIANLSDANDTFLLQKALTEMPEVLELGNAGTAMRFLTACLSITPGQWQLRGSKAMYQRPIKDLVDVLCFLGADIRYLGKKGFPPLLIHGKKLSGGKVKMPETISSQYISALLLIAPKLNGGLNLEIAKEQVSRPYIDLTLKLMRQLGISFTETREKISIPRQSYQAVDVEVEPDWTAASYWYSAVFCSSGGKIVLPGLKWPSVQGDSHLVNFFSGLGVTSLISDDKIRIFRNSEPQTPSFKANLKNYPDIIQTLAVAFCLKKLPFQFTGVEHLVYKETNRLEALEKELLKIGIKNLGVSKKYIKCDKFPFLYSATAPSIDTWGDHRMAMSFAMAAFACKNVRINNAEVVQKSYPGFWDDLKKTKMQVDELV